MIEIHFSYSKRNCGNQGRRQSELMPPTSQWRLLAGGKEVVLNSLSLGPSVLLLLSSKIWAKVYWPFKYKKEELWKATLFPNSAGTSQICI